MCNSAFIAATIQNYFLIWISRQTKKKHSPTTMSYSDQSFRFAPSWSTKKWNLGKSGQNKSPVQFLQMEREDVIPFWKFWTVPTQLWIFGWLGQAGQANPKFKIVAAMNAKLHISPQSEEKFIPTQTLGKLFIIKLEFQSQQENLPCASAVIVT